MSNEDINKLINGATNKLKMDLISFLIYTGRLKGEALNLKWDDVDLHNKRRACRRSAIFIKK